MENLVRQPVPLWRVLFFSFGYFGATLAVMLFVVGSSFFGSHINAVGSSTSFVWCLALLIGIVAQPVMGMVGDNKWGRYGRRGFFVLWASVLGAVALYFFAFASNLFWSVACLVIVLLALNTLFVSYHALITEVLAPKDRLLGYVLMAILNILAVVVALVVRECLAVYVVGDGGLSLTGNGFYTRSLLLISCVVLVVSSFFSLIFVQEYLGRDLKRFATFVPFTGETEEEIIEQGRVTYLRQGAMWLSGAVVMAVVFGSLGFAAETYVLPVLVFVYALMLMCAHMLNKSDDEPKSEVLWYLELVRDMQNMSWQQKQIMLVTICSWFALLVFSLGVRSLVLRSTSLRSVFMTQSVDFMYVIPLVSAFIFLFVLVVRHKKISPKQTLTLCLVLTAPALLLFSLLGSTWVLFVLLVLMGVLFASLLCLPYALICNTLPSRRVGVFMGLFSLSIFIPILLSPSIVRAEVASLGGDAHYTIIMSMWFIVAALVFMCFNKFKNKFRQKS